ncbi:MAG: hypothetical protein ING77_14580 [Rhodocyclaceae bacterium]|nr:hypothetical protein [Rhodocyclaceae bacterium]
MQELVERYGEGRRLYRWHHWCEDMVPPQWLHLVECRLIGSRATANASVMRSIAAGEAVKIRGGMYRAEDGADDGDHEVSSSDKVIDLDRYDFSDDYEEVDRAVRLALADRPELIHGAIQECAARGGIDPYGAKALDVYLELYDDPSGKVPPKRKRSQIAVRHGVSKAFVEEMAVTDALWWSLATHCSKGTIDQICDAILMRLPDPGRGSKNGPE